MSFSWPYFHSKCLKLKQALEIVTRCHLEIEGAVQSTLNLAKALSTVGMNDTMKYSHLYLALCKGYMMMWTSWILQKPSPSQMLVWIFAQNSFSEMYLSFQLHIVLTQFWVICYKGDTRLAWFHGKRTYLSVALRPAPKSYWQLCFVCYCFGSRSIVQPMDLACMLVVGFLLSLEKVVQKSMLMLTTPYSACTHPGSCYGIYMASTAVHAPGPKIVWHTHSLYS